MKIIIHETSEPLLAMRAAIYALSKGKPEGDVFRFISYEWPSYGDQLITFAVKWNKGSVSVWESK